MKSNEILVPLATGFEEVEAITIIDLLRRAGLHVTTTSLSPEKLVAGAHGIGVQADNTLVSVMDRNFAAIVLPGGMPGTTHLAKSRELEALILRHREAHAWIAAICAAPTVLAKYGLLNGKRATCYPGFETQLGSAKLEEGVVVEDDQIVTSRGPGTAIPFALRLIERLVGQTKATEVQKAVLSASEKF